MPTYKFIITAIYKMQIDEVFNRVSLINFFSRNGIKQPFYGYEKAPSIRRMFLLDFKTFAIQNKNGVEIRYRKRNISIDNRLFRDVFYFAKNYLTEDDLINYDSLAIKNKDNFYLFLDDFLEYKKNGDEFGIRKYRERFK